MWSRRLAMMVATITIAAVGTTAPAAQAGGQGDTLYGDFNADGIEDTAVLGVIEPDLCSTIVEYGQPSGSYLPPIAYTYLKPGDGSVYIACPDIGVAVDVDTDPADELWVGWTPGPPHTISYNQIVLQPPVFAPSATHTALITRPTFIGRGAFSGGGRYSPYDVGPGGVQNFVINGASVVPGPIFYCSVDAPSVQLTDWTRDGVEGTLVAYTDGCDDHSNGVLRIRENGSIQQLQIDLTRRTNWTARVVNANGDRFPDVRTIDQTTGEVDYFINDSTSNPGFLVRSPHANTDQVTLTSAKAIAIDVLANDHVSLSARLVVTVPPRYGSVQVLSDRRIVYRPDPTHGRTDRFSYQLVEEGKRSSATVNIKFPA